MLPSLPSVPPARPPHGQSSVPDVCKRKWGLSEGQPLVAPPTGPGSRPAARGLSDSDCTRHPVWAGSGGVSNNVSQRRTAAFRAAWAGQVKTSRWHQRRRDLETFTDQWFFLLFLISYKHIIGNKFISKAFNSFQNRTFRRILLGLRSEAH